VEKKKEQKPTKDEVKSQKKQTEEEKYETKLGISVKKADDLA